MTIQSIEGTFTEGNGHYTIVAGRFNAFVVESLVDGAIDTLKRHGVGESNIRVVRVPGAFEIPLAVKKVAELVGQVGVPVISLTSKILSFFNSAPAT